MPQHGGDLLDERLLDRARAHQRRRGERQPVGRPAHGDEAGAALLHDGSRRRMPPASSQAWQVPSVGWPANGSSVTGVKMRTR